MAGLGEEIAKMKASFLEDPECNSTWDQAKIECGIAADAETIPLDAFTKSLVKSLAEDEGMADDTELLAAIEMIAKIIDSDASGAVSKEEFICGLGLVNECFVEKRPPFEVPWALWLCIDTDNSGTITAKELVGLTKALLPKSVVASMSAAELDEAIKQLVDKAGSGGVMTPEQFEALCGDSDFQSLFLPKTTA